MSARRRRGLGSAPTKKVTAYLLVFSVLLIGASLWASPYWAAAGFAHAVQSRNPDAIAAYLDMQRLRDSLKRQTLALLRPKIDKGRNTLLGAVGVALGGVILDRAIDDHVSPEVIAKVFEPYLQDHTVSRFTIALRLTTDNRAQWIDINTFQIQISSDVVMTWKRDGFKWRLTGVSLPKPATPQPA